MCTWNAETTSRFGKEKWFPFEVWKELIDEAVPKGLKSIRLNQINEPLIHEYITWDNEKNSEEIGNEINFPKMTFNLIFCIGTSDITMDKE